MGEACEVARKEVGDARERRAACPAPPSRGSQPVAPLPSSPCPACRARERDHKTYRQRCAAPSSPRGRDQDRAAHLALSELAVKRCRRALEHGEGQCDAGVHGCERRALDELGAAHRDEPVLDELVERAAGFEEGCSQGGGVPSALVERRRKKGEGELCGSALRA